jgi:hypothetical protein
MNEKYLNNILRKNRRHAKNIGAKGGSAKSEAKSIAAKLNAQKPRKKTEAKK